MYFRRKIVALCTAMAVALPEVALATNGTLLIGTGRHRALGGAGVAMPLDATSQLVNPASATELGTRVDLGAMLFVPKRQACTRAVPECTKSGANLFFLPSMGGTYKFNRKISLGFAAAGVGGGSTRYKRGIFTSGEPASEIGSTGADLKQMIIAMTMAYRVNKSFSIGVSPLMGIQQFRAYGLQTFQTTGISNDIENITNRGNDWSYGGGIRLGALTRFFKDRLILGASYTSRIYMTKFDKYRGLFTEDGDFDMPEQFTVGLALKPINKLALVFDVTRVYFNDIPALGNSINNSVGTSTDPTTTGKLGARDGGGFGWDDQWIYKGGLSYEWNKKLTLRTGVNYGKAPVPEDDNLLPGAIAPVTTEWHAALGFSYALNRTSEVSVGYVHAFKNTLSNFDDGEFPISPGGGAEISMVQNSIDVNYSLRF